MKRAALGWFFIVAIHATAHADAIPGYTLIDLGAQGGQLSKDAAGNEFISGSDGALYPFPKAPLTEPTLPPGAPTMPPPPPSRTGCDCWGALSPRKLCI